MNAAKNVCREKKHLTKHIMKNKRQTKDANIKLIIYVLLFFPLESQIWKIRWILMPMTYSHWYHQTYDALFIKRRNDFSTVENWFGQEMRQILFHHVFCFFFVGFQQLKRGQLIWMLDNAIIDIDIDSNGKKCSSIRVIRWAFFFRVLSKFIHCRKMIALVCRLNTTH